MFIKERYKSLSEKASTMDKIYSKNTSFHVKFRITGKF